MGRLQDPKRVESKRAEVAAATLQTIARHGIEGASLRTIALEGGFTTGTLVYYFRNKQDILLFAGRTVLQGFIARLHQKVSDAPSLAALEAALLAELPSTEKKRLGWSIWLSFTTQAASKEIFRKEHEERSAEFRNLFRACIDAEDQTENRRSEADLASKIDRVLALYDGLGLHALLEPAHYSDSYQQHLLQQAMQSLKWA